MDEARMNAHYLAIGAIVYAGVSALWVTIAYFFGGVQAVILIVAVLLILTLIAMSIVTLRQALQIKPISAGSAELGKWFGIIFAAEGIAIGAGSGILVGLELTEWIAPWVALVVALHFFPLARLLKLPLDYVVGMGILLLTLFTVVALRTDLWAVVLGLGTAFLLWLAGWGRLYVAQQALRNLAHVNP